MNKISNTSGCGGISLYLSSGCLREESLEFKVSLEYIVISYLKKKKVSRTGDGIRPWAWFSVLRKQNQEKQMKASHNRTEMTFSL